MTEQLRFDDRVAIVTGGGGTPGLGRAYAHLLAERGARVVVNDLGVGPDGRDTAPASADAVVEEILDLGGEAIASIASVADPAGAESIVQSALDAWGRVDILINNAGIVHLADFDEISVRDIKGIIDVHLYGHIWMCRAVWPRMKEAGYGRIVNIASRSMRGGRDLATYGAAKGAVFALTRSLAVEGAPYGIVVNSLSPHALTMATLQSQEDSEWLKETAEIAQPELVAPVAGLLAHELCEFSGRCVEAFEGRAYEIFLSRTPGYVNRDLTIEDVHENLDVIFDRDDAAPLPEAIEVARGKSRFQPRPYVAADASDG